MKFRAKHLMGLVALTLIMVPMAISPAAAQGRGRQAPSPTLLSDSQQSWVNESSQWVNLTWTADEGIEDLRVTATSNHRGVVVAYSETTGDYAGLSEDADLAANEIDHTALHISTSSRTPKNFLVKLTVQWSADGDRYSATTNLRFRGAAYQGAAFAAMSDTIDVSLTDPADSWVDLDYAGLAPQTTDFTVAVSGPGIEIYHPQVSFTSLHHDAVLSAGETDTARVWLNPDVVLAGTYEITVRIDYSVSGEAEQMTHNVKLNVTG